MSTIEFEVVSAQLRIEEDSLLGHARLEISLVLAVSSECDPPQLPDGDLRQTAWYATLSADELGEETEDRVGKLKCREFNKRRSCWLTLKLGSARFDALRAALLSRNPIDELTITSTTLANTTTWESMLKQHVDIEGFELVIGLSASPIKHQS